jgi:hypothetical protein
MRQLFKRLGNVSRMIRIVPLTALAAAAVVALFSASGARAGCGEPFKARSGTVLSWMEHQGNSEEHEGQGESNGPPTIVGLWHLKYTADDGSAFLESFKIWHADGTEFENAFLPPVGGNICFGVWKETGRLSVKLHHIGLMFNPDGSIKATFTVDEADTVATDNKTYKGTFDFKIFDQSGNVVIEVKGTTAGTRITVD